MIGTKFKNLFKKFPITSIGTIALSLICLIITAIIYANSLFDYLNWVDILKFFTLSFCSSSFLIESIFYSYDDQNIDVENIDVKTKDNSKVKNKKNIDVKKILNGKNNHSILKLILIGISIIVAILFSYTNAKLFDSEFSYTKFVIKYRVFETVYLCEILIGIFILFKKIKIPTDVVINNILINSWKSVLSFIVIYESIIYLVKNSYIYFDSDTVANYIEFIIKLVCIGILIIPNILITIANINTKSQVKKIKDSKDIITKFIAPITIVVTFLSLLYLLFNIAVISINFVSIIAYMIIAINILYTSILSYKENNTIISFTKLLPYITCILIIPCIYVEVSYVQKYGISPYNYGIIGLFILELIYNLIYIFNKKQIKLIALFTAFAITFSNLMPNINKYDLSIKSFENLINNYLMQDEIDLSKAPHIYSNYVYLTNIEQEQDYIKKLDENTKFKEAVLEYENNQFLGMDSSDEEENIICYSANNKNGVKIGDYKYLEFAYYYNENTMELSEFENIQMQTNKDNLKIATINILDIVNKMLEMKPKDNSSLTEEDYAKLDQLLENNSIVKAGNKDVSLMQVFFYYDKTTNTISNAGVYGLVLEK